MTSQSTGGFLAWLRHTARAKRQARGLFWRTVFSAKDSADAARAARRRRRRGNAQKDALRREVRAYARIPPPSLPKWQAFHLQSAVLRTHAEAVAAINEVRSLGFEPHDSSDRKNWDSLAAVSAILKTTGPSARILDAGSAFKSKVLPWLSAYGYTHLIGIDLSHTSRMQVGRIIYEYGDLTRTTFEDGYFDVVTCISVIEHGVDHASCFRELWRILKPGGILIVSTDYWPDRMDSHDMRAFNASWRIFDRDDMRRMVDTARSSGFVLDGELALDAQEKTVAWSGREYTFIYFVLRKPSSAGVPRTAVTADLAGGVA